MSVTAVTVGEYCTFPVRVLAGTVRSYKLHDFALGPASVVGGVGSVPAVALAEEGAVAAVRRLDIGDIGIGGDAAQGFGLHADEGIVLCVDYQSRHRDAVDYVRCRGPGVIVVGSCKPAIVGGNAVVELTQGGNARAGATGQTCPGKSAPCGASAGKTASGSSTRKCGSRARAERRQRRPGPSPDRPPRLLAIAAGPFISPLAGQLQHQVAAHGKSDRARSVRRHRSRAHGAPQRRHRQTGSSCRAWAHSDPYRRSCAGS